MFEDEYQKNSFFSFLKKHAKGQSDNVKMFKTERIGLKSFDYVKKHPKSDIEKWYIKEIVNILSQAEVRTLLDFLKKKAVTLDDDENNLIICSAGSNNFKKANVFIYPLEEPLCIPRNSIYVDDNGLLLSDHSVHSFKMCYDTEIGSFVVVGK